MATISKTLRPFFRHDRRLFADVSRLICRLLAKFYDEAAGRSLLTGMAIAHPTFGDMLRWNPHFHAIVLEGGFDDGGTFFYVPFSGLEAMTEVFRRRVIKLLVERGLLHEGFAGNLLSWKHWRLQHRQQRAHPRRIVTGEPRRVHRTATDLAGENPLRTVQAARAFGRWEEMPWVAERTPEGCKDSHPTAPTSEEHGYKPLSESEEEIDVNARKRAWARLLSKVYEVDPLVCQGAVPR